jgi:DNA mismatch endonuclease (patch repair protein)
MGQRADRVRKNMGTIRDFVNVDPMRSHTMSRIRGRGNRSTEGRVRAALACAGIRGWRLHPKDIIGTPDFYFPGAQIVVFIDGCFWHGCKSCYRRPHSRQTYWDLKLARNKKRDRQVNRLLRKSGYRLLRFWEHDAVGRLSSIIRSIQLTLEHPSEPHSSTAFKRQHPAAKQRHSMPHRGI